MNEYDRENLSFLLNADEDTLRDWYEKMDKDDHEYASELLVAYSEELKTRQRFIDIESVNIDNLVPDAVEYLKKFRL
jgi:hypothetical protein